MAQLRQVKLDFLQALVASGATRLTPTGDRAADFYGQRWQKSLYKTPEAIFPLAPRLVNRFKLGADPEFILMRPAEHGVEPRPAKRINASEAKLLTGLFVGADQNGRLVEVRPKPSRFALRVLASILASLRWAVALKPELLEFEWKTGAYLEGDGLGGHIHFGRKRASRPEEIVGLDAIAATLKRTRAFPVEQWDKRLAGDERNQQYGKFSDYRLQNHGYEYRTLPSWLDNPWTAYLSLVVSKLAVFNPKLVESWFLNTTVKENGILNLLAYYKEMDDDARIAYLAFQRLGMPRYTCKDIRAAWGLLFPSLHSHSEVEILPQTISPTREDLSDCFEFLVRGISLPTREPEKPNWDYQVPKGFESLRYPKMSMGMGELTWDLLGLTKCPINIIPGSDEQLQVYVPFPVPGLYAALKPSFNILHVSKWTGNRFQISVPRYIKKSPQKIAKLRKLLVENLPVFRHGAIDPAKVAKWSGPQEQQVFKTKKLEEN